MNFRKAKQPKVPIYNFFSSETDYGESRPEALLAGG